MKTALAVAALLAGTARALPPPARSAGDDRLVVATTAQLAPILHRVARELERERPGVHVSIVAVGSDVAMAQLYTRRADLAVIGRPAFDPEVKAFQWIFQYPPTAWAVLRGSSTTPGHSPAIRLLVNAANPIRSISARQVELAFRKDAPVRWRDLGVAGPLAPRPVHAFMPDAEQGTGRFIRHALFQDATLFAWNRITEIAEPLRRDGSDDRAGRRIAAAVARDPLALALVPGGSVPGTRAVPLHCEALGQSLCDSEGALERDVYAYADPALRPDARSFLRLLIGSAPQGTIDPAPYRPLPPGEGREQLDKLR
jgi:phosphate transport system substrate-binding protein